MKKGMVLFVCFVMVTCLFAETWDESQKIVASDRRSDDLFGMVVAIDGDYAVVGSPYNSYDANGANYVSDAGAVYVYKMESNGTWSQEAKLVASDRESSDFFGRAISIQGDYIVVGAYGEDDDLDGNNSLERAGSAYVFKRDSGSGTWTQEVKLIASDREEGDRFGGDVDIDGNYIVVGAYYESSYQGAAYIYYYDGTAWGQQAKIMASDPGSRDYFASDVAISGDYIVAGSENDDEDASNANTLNNTGSAYVFHRSGTTWTQMAKLVALDREEAANFGVAVDIEDDVLFVGAKFKDEDDGNGTIIENAGAVYVYKLEGGTWTQNAKLLASDMGAGDALGRNISADSNYVCLGVSLDDEDADDENYLAQAGSAYIFKCDESGTWTQEAKVVSSDRAEIDYFGVDIAISGSTVIVGSYYEDEDASNDNTLTNAGSAYFFTLSSSEPPLPITLGSFSAAAKNGSVNLSWTTESETNNMAFNIYRNDELLASLEGAGTTSETQSYSYIDAAVIPGVQYTYVLADVDYSNTETRYEDEAVTVMINESDIVTDFAVSEAYPNPFNPSTSIDYQLPESREVSLNVYDLNGHKIQALVNGVQDMGYYTVSFNAGNLPSGMYIARLSAGDDVQTMKLVLMK